MVLIGWTTSLYQPSISLKVLLQTFNDAIISKVKVVRLLTILQEQRTDPPALSLSVETGTYGSAE